MSIREMAARVLFSDPVDNYLGTVLTALDLICSDINCLYSTDSTYAGLLENLCDTYCDSTFYNPKKYVIDPELKRVSKPDAYSPYI